MKKFRFRRLYICNGIIADGAVICFGNSPHMEGWPLWYLIKIHEKYFKPLLFLKNTL